MAAILKSKMTAENGVWETASIKFHEVETVLVLTP